jgi:hypothetical protein
METQLTATLGDTRRHSATLGDTRRHWSKGRRWDKSRISSDQTNEIHASADSAESVVVAACGLPGSLREPKLRIHGCRHLPMFQSQKTEQTTPL